MAWWVRRAMQCLPYSRLAVVAVSLPKLSHWQRTKAANIELIPTRRGFHEKLAEQLRGMRILFLEFGVFQGESIKYWLTLNDNPGSRFVGFDTFTGLPEKWHTNFGQVDAGSFDVGGNAPVVSDSRCSFRKGIFQDTLPVFLEGLDATSYDNIVLHLDADLYSSTLFVLAECNALIRVGTILVFDEFPSVLNEFRAFEDWAAAYQRRYTPLLATSRIEQVAIRID